MDLPPEVKKLRDRFFQVLAEAAAPFLAAQKELAARIKVTSRLAPAMAFIKEHYHEPVSIRAMAQTCGLSLGSFHRQFRDTYLCTPHTYVRQLRVRMSCHALVFSRRPIAAVAAECGFSDQSHFTKEFRRIMGETPRNYRRQHRH